MTRRLTLVTALALSAGAIGCSSNADPASGPAPQETHVMVRVTNHNWSDMTVYAMAASQRRRLGQVTSMSTQTFRIPKSIVSTGARVSLIADPIGGMEQFTAPAIDIWPGQLLDFTIHNQLSISSVAAWRQ